MKGILGRKIGMLQVFDNHGKVIPVTLVDVKNNVVLQEKTKEKDGYSAFQIGFEEKSPKNVSKALKGHFNKAKTTSKRFIREIRDMNHAEVGSTISPKIFKLGEIVDVEGTTRGHGFTGSIKLHNYSRGPMGHGSGYHRGVGSMGGRTCNRVFKSKLMPGRYGADKVTIQNLQIVYINDKDGYVLVKGCIPGAKNSCVFIKESIKTPGKVLDVKLSNAKDEALLKVLLEEARRLDVQLTTDMSIEEMTALVEKAKVEGPKEHVTIKEEGEDQTSDSDKTEEESKS